MTRPGALLGDPADLAQLLHQVGLGVQAAGGVGEHEVDARGRRPRSTASKTTALGSPPSLPRTSSAPARSAHVASCSAAAARNVSPAAISTRAAVGDLLVGDLADGGRLADAVDADEQPHVRAAVGGRLEVQRPVGAVELALHVVLQRVEQLRRAR